MPHCDDYDNSKKKKVLQWEMRQSDSAEFQGGNSEFI